MAKCVSKKFVSSLAKINQKKGGTMKTAGGVAGSAINKPVSEVDVRYNHFKWQTLLMYSLLYLFL